MGYPKQYDEAWAATTAKPAYSWGIAPIHHGFFENGWCGALEAAARIIEQGGTAQDIRALAIYAEEPDDAAPETIRPHHERNVHDPDSINNEGL